MAEKNSISFENLLADLKNRIYHPVYLLHGEEPYFIDAISDYIAGHVLSEQEQEFNQTVVYGKDSDVLTLIGQARRYPMMANYQVLIVREAQELEDFEKLQPYIENPLTSTILVLCYKYGKIDGRKTLYKAIEKTGIIFHSARLFDNRVPDWIESYLRRQKLSISPKAALLLTDFLGAELGKIVNEIQKLMINLPEGAVIDEDCVEKNIGISKDFNVFELQKALARKDVVKANRIALYFGSNPKENPAVKIIPMLSSFFTKILTFHYLPDKSTNTAAAALGINPYFVAEYQQAARSFPLARTVEIISLLREFDLKSKSIGSPGIPDGELMKELIFRMLHQDHSTR
jgi:DNA polymerase-3 subunit delta